jgi:anti-anti-sigma regulatory factor
MYAVEADAAKRIVVISAAGRVTKEELKAAAQEVGEILKNFEPGFRLFADFRWLEAMDSAAARHIAEIMDMMTKKQVAEVIRVMPDPHKDIGLNILSKFHYDPTIRIVTYETLAEALASVTESRTEIKK